MKFSKQRELIRKTVVENNVHPTADDVYAMLKPSNPSLSLGTVYRNLTVLADNGVINRLRMPNGSDRFDGQMYEHYHVICRDCGKIFDIKLALLKELDEKVEKETGVAAISHQLIINGVCSECQTKHKGELK